MENSKEKQREISQDTLEFMLRVEEILPFDLFQKKPNDLLII